MAQRNDDPSDVLVGRLSERATLHDFVASVRAGAGAVLVIRGDPGIGKTALLDDLAAKHPDLTTERIIGAEAEADLAFAGIQRLIVRHKVFVDKLPAPQHHALLVTLGVEFGPPPARFLVGLGMHALLGAVARSGPILILVDDLQWLDQESIDVLAFVARRLDSGGIGMITAQRSDSAVTAFDPLPSLRVAGLAPSDALTLLRRVVTRPLEARISDQIFTATNGNPLAIIDLARELSTHQLVGLTLLPEPMPVGSHLQAHYLRQLEAMPADVQTWLLLAAAEPSGDLAYVAAGSAVLGIDVDAGDLAEARNLVRAEERIVFRHPLVRSAIYGGATAGQRRRVHTALAAVTRRAGDTDRRAWHLAAGCIGPDEDVADVLERAAERARERGGYSARASLLVRAVELTPDGPRRTARTLAAAEAAMTAGRAMQTLALLDGLDVTSLDEIDRGRALMIRASTQGFTGETGAMATIPAICAAAADAFAPQAPERARDALVMAFERSLGAEWMMTGTTVADLAERARRIASPDRSALADVVLQALATLALVPFPSALPDIRLAIDALRADDLPADQLLQFAWTSVALTTAVWDDEARTTILDRAIGIARQAGAVQVLDALLFIQSLCETVLGQLDSAGGHLTELREVRDALGMSAAQQEMFRNIEYLAWLGDHGDRDALLNRIEPPARRPWLSDWAARKPSAGPRSCWSISARATMRPPIRSPVTTGISISCRSVFGCCRIWWRRPPGPAGTRKRGSPCTNCGTLLARRGRPGAWECWRSRRPCAPAMTTRNRTTRRRSRICPAAAPARIWLAPICCTANGCGGDGGASRPGSSSGPRSGTSRTWVRRGSRAEPAGNSPPPASPQANP